MKEYRLVGPNAGKTVVLGGFKWDEGKLSVQDTDVAAVEPIITRFYSAVPAQNFARAQREYEEANKPAEGAPPPQDPNKGKGEGK